MVLPPGCPFNITNGTLCGEALVVPLLSQMGKLTGDAKYFDDAAAQVIGMSKHLFVPEKGLFAHGWHPRIRLASARAG